MSMFEVDTAPANLGDEPMARSEIDRVLTAQVVVAWAGEDDEGRRLGWWRTDLNSEFGGEDLFRRLLPNSWQWALLQGAREAARRQDAALRAPDHDPDGVVTLFHLGLRLDELVQERLEDLKRSQQPPTAALPGLVPTIAAGWTEQRFCDWIHGHGEVEHGAVPGGRRIKGALPSRLDQLVRGLVGALAPLAKTYPLPHYRRGT